MRPPDAARRGRPAAQRRSCFGSWQTGSHDEVDEDRSWAVSPTWVVVDRVVRREEHAAAAGGLDAHRQSDAFARIVHAPADDDVCGSRRSAHRGVDVDLVRTSASMCSSSPRRRGRRRRSWSPRRERRRPFCRRARRGGARRRPPRCPSRSANRRRCEQRRGPRVGARVVGVGRRVQVVRAEVDGRREDRVEPLARQSVT